MFAYCGNNPVMGYDPSGEWSWNAFFESAVLSYCAAAIVVVVVAAIVVATGGSGAIIVAAATAGAVSGLLTSISTANEYESGENISMNDSRNILKDVAIDTGLAAVSATVSGVLDGKKNIKKIVGASIECAKELYEYSTDFDNSGQKFTPKDIQEYVISNHLPNILWNIFKEAIFY